MGEGRPIGRRLARVMGHWVPAAFRKQPEGLVACLRVSPPVCSQLLPELQSAELPKAFFGREMFDGRQALKFGDFGERQSDGLDGGHSARHPVTATLDA